MKLLMQQLESNRYSNYGFLPLAIWLIEDRQVTVSTHNKENWWGIGPRCHHILKDYANKKSEVIGLNYQNGISIIQASFKISDTVLDVILYFHEQVQLALFDYSLSLMRQMW